MQRQDALVVGCAPPLERRTIMGAHRGDARHMRQGGIIIPVDRPDLPSVSRARRRHEQDRLLCVLQRVHMGLATATGGPPTTYPGRAVCAAVFRLRRVLFDGHSHVQGVLLLASYVCVCFVPRHMCCARAIGVRGALPCAMCGPREVLCTAVACAVCLGLLLYKCQVILEVPYCIRVRTASPGSHGSAWRFSRIDGSQYVDVHVHRVGGGRLKKGCRAGRPGGGR